MPSGGGKVTGEGGLSVRLTKDDERARRIGSLALEFMNAAGPLPSSEIARHFYPALSPDSFRRAFSRDREALLTCGIVVAERRRPGLESSWEVDEEASFPQGAELAPLEAAALEISCQPLLDDPTFPFTRDLRIALAKLTRSFAEGLVVAPAASATETRATATLRECLMAGHAARISYTDARGRESERLIAPYGFFSLGKALYLVAGRVDEKGTPQEDGTRTYRTDRVRAAVAIPTVAVEVPADFCVDDWRRLPFQMGSAQVPCTFLIPADRQDDAGRITRGQGTLEATEGGLAWTVGACDPTAAARWAVAQGIVPQAPGALVDACRALLEEVVGDAA